MADRVYAVVTNEAGTNLESKLSGRTIGTIESVTDVTVTNTQTIPAGVRLKPRNGAKYIKGTNGKLVFSGEGIDCQERRQIFQGFSAGDIIWTGQYPPVIYPEWFGVVPSSSDSGVRTANSAALNSMFDAFRSGVTNSLGGSNAYLASGAEVLFAKAQYFFDAGVQINARSIVRGVPGTRLVFGNNTFGFRVNSNQTADGGAYPSGEERSAADSHFECLEIWGQPGATTHTVSVVGRTVTKSAGEDFVGNQGYMDGYTFTYGTRSYVLEGNPTSTSVVTMRPYRLMLSKRATNTFNLNYDNQSVPAEWIGAEITFPDGTTREIIETGQMEYTTIVGTITSSGNAQVTITATGMTNSPKTINVAVLNGDLPYSVTGGATGVVEKMATALNADSDFNAMFVAWANPSYDPRLFIKRKVAGANIADLNIAYTNGTCTGLTPDATSDTYTDAYILSIAAGTHPSNVSGTPFGSGYTGDECEITSFTNAPFDNIQVRFNKWHGLDVRARITTQDVTVREFAGHGVSHDSTRLPSISGDQSANSNNSRHIGLHVYSNAGNGFYTKGINANSSEIYNIDTQNNKGFGVYDNPQHANLYAGGHSSHDHQGNILGIHSIQGSTWIKPYIEAGMPQIKLEGSAHVIGGSYNNGMTTGRTQNSGVEQSAASTLNWRGSPYEAVFVGSPGSGSGLSGAGGSGLGSIFSSVGAPGLYKSFQTFGLIAYELMYGIYVARRVKAYHWINSRIGKYGLAYYPHEITGNPIGTPYDPVMEITNDDAAEGAGEIIFPKGIILVSPNGTQYKLTVSNAGAAVFTQL